MRKDEYLDLLRYYLRKFPKAVIDDIIADYEEHFAIGMHNGKSEEEIAEELGTPKLVAEEYLEGNFEHKPSFEAEEWDEPEAEEEMPQKTRMFSDREFDKDMLIKILLILGILAVLSRVVPFFFRVFGGVVGAVVGIVLALFFGLGGLAIASIVFGVALCFHSITGYLIWPSAFFLYGFSAVTQIFLGLGFIGLGSILMIAAKKVFTASWTGAKKLYYYLKWQIIKRRNA